VCTEECISGAKISFRMCNSIILSMLYHVTDAFDVRRAFTAKNCRCSHTLYTRTGNNSVYEKKHISRYKISSWMYESVILCILVGDVFDVRRCFTTKIRLRAQIIQGLCFNYEHIQSCYIWKNTFPVRK